MTDENVDPDVAAYLRGLGFDVVGVADIGLQGCPDIDLMAHAVGDDRVILSHDADFGTLAMYQGQPMIGVIYLRPGHIDPAYTIATIDAVLRADPDLQPPFMLIAKRSEQQVTIRVRHPAPSGDPPIGE